jgi:transposase InsO family protein
LNRVFLGMAMFPSVIRSDNAQEFTSAVVKELNRMLDIRHITSSTDHPQSQGKVERMHSTLGHVVRGLVDGHADDWERMLPFAECILRCSPYASVRGSVSVRSSDRPETPYAFCYHE